jgi:uncharacterized membrane protein (DUF106 family)
MLAMILAWADFIDLVSRPPHSLWFIFLICVVVSLISTFLNKKLVDHEKAERIQKVVSEHNKKKKELLKLSEENPRKYAKEYPKWQRRDASVQKMQQSMSLNRLKPTCITLVPMIVFFYAVRSIYTPDSYSIQMPVARPPMNPMDEFPAFIVTLMRSQLFSAIGNITVSMGFLGFTGYYMLCSFTTQSLLQKIFKVSSPSAQTGGGSLFDTTAQMELPKPGSF